MSSNTIKDCTFELKSLSADGTFEGLAAVYNVVDDYGDCIERGAFTKTLAARGGKVPIFWQHQLSEPIGIGTLSDLDEGLWIQGRLNLEVKRAREMHSLMKQAKAEHMPFGLSIGFDTVRAVWKGTTRFVSEVRLWEVSPTMFPAQSLAVVAGVKSITPDAVVAGVSTTPDAADLARFRADLAEQRAWAEEQLRALSDLNPEAQFALRYRCRTGEERRTLALRLSAVAEANREHREMLERLLDQLDRAEALLDTAASSPKEAAWS